MKQEEYIRKSVLDKIPNHTVIGVDIGSRQAKAVLLSNGNIYKVIASTGFYMQQTAEHLIDDLLSQSGLSKKDIEYIVVTGYGRVSLAFDSIPYRSVTEIACHGKGAFYLADDIHTIIDIGGQDSKVIKIDPKDGTVIDFAMNDKCAAGTGRYLEKIANVLGYDVKEIGPASLRADKTAPVNSTCVVFAESEVVSSRAKGETAENLAAGIHMSVANRVNGLLSRVGIESNVLFTGGVSNNVGMVHAFEELLDIKIVESKLNTVYAGALGAAAFAAEYKEKNVPSTVGKTDEESFKLDLSSLENALTEQEQKYINKSTGTKANVAYTCNYTPVEVLAAADVAARRFMHRGTPDEIIAGETLTQSMVCDLNKSLAGGFINHRPDVEAIDKLYTFYACSCMRATVEAIDSLYRPAAVFNVPRLRHEGPAKEFLTTEIESFKKDLEELTGKKISDELIEEKARLYNQAKKEIRSIAEYRKKDIPLVSSLEFARITSAYYNLPVEILLPELAKIKAQLKNARAGGRKKLRLMLSGGTVAEGDTKIVSIVEQELDESIVVEDSCTGIKPLDIDVKFDSNQTIYENLSDAYLGKAPCVRMYSMEETAEKSIELAKEYNVDGVILYYLKFCPCFSMTEKMYTDLFRKHDIPLFIISGDYAVGDEGQIKTRIEAFTEMLWERKGN